MSEMGQIKIFRGVTIPLAVLILTILVLAGCTAPVAPSQPAAEGEATQEEAAGEMPRLVVSVWGGSYADEFKEQVADPFAEQFGVEVVVDGGPSSERLAKILATKDNPEADLFYITDYQAAIANQAGALLPIRPENFENLDELYDFAKDPLGGNTCPAFTVLNAGLAYNTDHWDEPPTSWNDMWREDLPGDVGYPNMVTSYAPLLLLQLSEMNGGGVDNVDPGFAKIEELKDHIFLYTVQESLQALNQGDVSITPQLNIFVAKDPDAVAQFVTPEEGGLGIVNLVCVVNGTQNQELAEKFIDFHLAQEQQLNMAVNQGESPTNMMVEVPEDLPYNLVVGEEAVNSLNFWDPNVDRRQPRRLARALARRNRRRMTGGAVEVQDIVKRFGPVRAVDNVSFTAQAGSFVTLLGPSGCGKTTTLRMVAGFEPADGGVIRIGGQVVNRVPAWKRQIGVVFQNYALFPHLTVFENVSFGLRQRKVPRAEIRQQVDKISATG